MSTPTFGPPSSATHHPSSAAGAAAALTPTPTFAAAAATAQGVPGRGGHHDDITFGTGATGAHAQGWDQFAANEQLFGVRTQFDEDAYTTRIDRTRADFKERERRAAAIASEISSVRLSPPPPFASSSARRSRVCAHAHSRRRTTRISPRSA